jgi:uncharacterized damage-inducible protein DinB
MSPTPAAAPEPAPTPVAAPAHSLLFADFAGEHKSTRRLLERYPDGKGEWKPHEKSRSLAQLATHVADVVNRGTTILESDELVMGSRTPMVPIDSAKDLLAHFNSGVERFERALEKVTGDRLAAAWSMRAGDRVLVEKPRREMLRFLMMSHLIHHRAQLGVYYRLLGVSVPGMYGPSADD